jgi:hypothetical protein
MRKDLLPPAISKEGERDSQALSIMGFILSPCD